MGEEKDKKKHKHSSVSVKSHRALNYFGVPIIYALILLIVVLPIEFTINAKINNHIIDEYKNAKEHSFYDEVIIKRTLPLSDNESNTVTYKAIAQNEGYGEIICESVGLNCDVYRGENSFCNLRAGVGSKDNLPGGEEPVVVYGYSTKYFKKLFNVKKNDIVVFNTTYGKYQYKVSDIKIADSFDQNTLTNKNSLVMYCSNGRDVFDCNKPSKLYVVADLISGPKATEDVK